MGLHFNCILYEPICLVTLGGTLGHLSGGMKVVKEKDHSRKINIFQALARIIIKVILGLISLFIVNTANKGRATHDMAVKSMVVFKEEVEAN